MDYDVRAIDRAIGAYIGANRMTASEFASAIGIKAPMTLRRKRLGESEWSFAEVCKVARITGASIDDFAGLSKPQLA